MKEEEVVRAAFAAWNDGGFDALLEYLAPDVEWHAPPDYPEGDVWHGREALARDWRDQFDSVFSESTVELAELLRAPQGWYAVIRSTARAEASGMGVEWQTFFLTRLDEGRFKEVWLFLDEAQAREEAGLDPAGRSRGA